MSNELSEGMDDGNVTDGNARRDSGSFPFGKEATPGWWLLNAALVLLALGLLFLLLRRACFGAAGRSPPPPPQA